MVKETTVTSDGAIKNLTDGYGYVHPVTRNDQIAEFDITFLDQAGKIQFTMTGFTTKKVPNRAALLGEPQAKKPIVPRSFEAMTIQGEGLEEKIQSYIKVKIASIIKKPATSLSLSRNFMDMGVESSNMIGASRAIEQELGIELYPTLFFEHQKHW